MGSLQSQGCRITTSPSATWRSCKIVKKLREVQGSLVDTYTWRGLLGIGVYGMLDISIYHSTNSLVTREGVEEDEEAQAGIAEFRPRLRRSEPERQGGAAATSTTSVASSTCTTATGRVRATASTAPTPALVSAATAGWKRASSAMTATSPTPTPARRSVRTTSAVTARYCGREACDDGNRQHRRLHQHLHGRSLR